MVVSVTTNLVGTAGEELFGDFLLRFWDYDSSPYVAERQGFGHAIGENQCIRNAVMLVG